MLIMLFITHYVSDFILQSREVAKKKSTDVKFLFEHTFTTFLFFLLIVTIITFFRNVDSNGIIRNTVETGLKNTLIFCFLNSVFHTIIDGTIWNLYKWYRFRELNEREIDNFKFWEDKLFFDTIGFDQLLHISIIVILYEVYLK